jgi:phosphopantetheinyl transferase
MKEAFLKYTGEGISDNLKYTLSDDRLLEINVETYVDIGRGFVYTLCNKKIS